MRYILLILCLLVNVPTWSQYTKYASEDKKALRYYEEARQYLKRAQFREAMEPLQDALDRDPKFIEVWLAMGSAHYQIGKDSLSYSYFRQALQINPDYQKSKYAYHAIGEYFFNKANYDSARSYLEHYLRTAPGDPRKETQAREMIRNCRFALQAMANPFDYDLRQLPDSANHFMLQYFPALSVDQQTLYFTRREGLNQLQDEDVYYSTKNNDGSWSMPRSISSNINTRENEGAASISADGRTLVFTSCAGRRGYGSCDIYVAYKEGDDWSEPKNIGDKINSASWEAQPSLTADGRTIYFVSNRPGGSGGKDIWVAKKDRRGKWQPAENLGKTVNSKKDDISPFVHANGESIYFASNGHDGLGGLDIYMTEQKDSLWSAPVNLGYPLNDAHDQVSLFVSSDGKTGVYTREKKENYRYESKLFAVNIPDSFRVSNKSSYLKGTVKDIESGEPLASKIKIYKLVDADFYSELNSDKVNGTYTIVLTEGNRYGIYVTSPGYVFHDFQFDVDDLSSFDQNLLDISLQKIKVGAKTVLGNIFFAFDEYSLKRESMSELRVVYYFLRNNPGVKVEISGHTDAKGSSSYNQDLSEKRAQTVYNFLLKKGIKESQLDFKGYGSSQPLTKNNDEAADAQNRRIEFKIVSTDKRTNNR